MKISDDAVKAATSDYIGPAYDNGDPGLRAVFEDSMRSALTAAAPHIRRDAAEEIISELERCALVLAAESDERGNYLVAAVLQKAVDIARTTAGIEEEA